MKNRMLAVFCGFCIAGSTLLASAAVKIGVVDMSKVFSSSAQVRQINTDLTKQFSSQKKSLIKKRTGLRQLVMTYQKQDAVLTTQKRQVMENTINAKTQALNRDTSVYQRAVAVAQKNKMSKFLGQLKHVVGGIAEKDHLDLVLPSNTVLYSSKSNTDITSQVVGELK